MRRDKNLSQEQLAELLGVSRQAVSKWEQDSGSPNYPETEKLIQLAQKLDVSLDALLLNRRPEAKTSAPAPLPDGKIFIKTNLLDSAYTSYNKFAIQKNFFPGKNQAKFFLNGVECHGVGFWGKSETLTVLGVYVTRKEAERELAEIHKAIQCGETAYEIKYSAKVKEEWHGYVLDD